MAQDDSTKTLIILGVAAVGAWYLYEQGYLYEWTGLAALYPGVAPPQTGSSTTSSGSSTTSSGSSTTSSGSSTPPSTPAAATVALAGSVTSDVNDSLAANVSINGVIQNLSCIPGGQCYDTSGNGVTLPSSVTAAQIYALMQAAYTPAPLVPVAPVPVAPAFAIQGAVTPDVNDSLSANVSINGGAPINISIIQSSAQAYNTSGQNITATLTGEGVSVPALLAAMQARHPGNPAATSHLGMFSGTRVRMGSIHGMGYARLRRGALQ